MKLKSIGRLLLLASLTLLMAARCSSGVQVSAHFENTQDIKEGTVVYFENEAVGEVVDVEATNGGSVVRLALSEEAPKSISSNAAVVVNRLKQGAPLEIYNRDIAGQETLKDGQELKGFDSMLQLGAWMVGDAIQLGSGSVSDLVQSFQDYLQGDKFQQDKAEVTAQIGAATTAAQEALKTIEQDVNTAVQELVDSEGDAAKSIEQLGEELSPLVGELAKSGTILAEQLEQFTKGLQEAQNEEQQAGQTLIDSLTAMLEKLNRSMQQGAENSDSGEQAESEITE